LVLGWKGPRTTWSKIEKTLKIFCALQHRNQCCQNPTDTDQELRIRLPPFHAKIRLPKLLLRSLVVPVERRVPEKNKYPRASEYVSNPAYVFLYVFFKFKK
jgi:hypothetical protein